MAMGTEGTAEFGAPTGPLGEVWVGALGPPVRLVRTERERGGESTRRPAGVPLREEDGGGWR